MKQSRTIILITLLGLFPVTAVAQNAADCANLMKFGIYDRFRTLTSESQYKQVRNFFETNSFHSRQEAQAKGTELGLNIEDVLNLSFNGTSSSSNFDVWQQRFLQTSYEEAAAQGLTASSIDTISGKITTLVGQCLTRQGLHAYIIPSADNQNFTLTADFAPFSASQASIPGTITVTPASVSAQCSPNSLLNQQVSIGPGGVALSCRRLPTETVAVVVNTPPEIGMSARFTYDAFVNPPPVVRFDATPAQIDKGQTATLSWEVRNALQVSLLDFGSVLATGNRSVAPSQTTEYRLSVTGLNGQTQSVPRTITVIQPPPPPPKLSSAQVFFRTTNDDKDGDTNVLVNVECSSGTIATISGTFGHWDDNTNNGPFGMNVLIGQPKNQISGCRAHLIEGPNGNDEWHFDWWVELKFSDGSLVRQSGSGNVDSDRQHAFINF
jgi:hypothetical protein